MISLKQKLIAIIQKENNISFDLINISNNNRYNHAIV